MQPLSSKAEWREQQHRADEWIKTVPETDYHGIAEALRALRDAVEIK